MADVPPPPSFTSAAEGAVVGQRPTIAGTGVPGATVTVRNISLLGLGTSVGTPAHGITSNRRTSRQLVMLTAVAAAMALAPALTGPAFAAPGQPAAPITTAPQLTAAPALTTSSKPADPFGSDDKYDTFGYDRSGYDRWGYDHWGYDRWGYDDKGYTEKGCARKGEDRPNADHAACEQRRQQRSTGSSGS
ncbi:hypothetical protein AB0L63_25805 [Nocardia sp. NPDC051990]|uniref:hypothetical protein n=1 Tax=Nocardia sp. NPDC051990 TaxID=3155285 RepID=UPI003448F20D